MGIIATMQQIREMMTPGQLDAMPGLKLVGWFELGPLFRPRGISKMPFAATAANPSLEHPPRPPQLQPQPQPGKAEAGICTRSR